MFVKELKDPSLKSVEKGFLSPKVSESLWNKCLPHPSKFTHLHTCGDTCGSHKRPDTKLLTDLVPIVPLIDVLES